MAVALKNNYVNNMHISQNLANKKNVKATAGDVILSKSEWNEFVDIMQNPPEPNDSLREILHNV